MARSDSIGKRLEAIKAMTTNNGDKQQTEATKVLKIRVEQLRKKNDGRLYAMLTIVGGHWLKSSR